MSRQRLYKKWKFLAPLGLVLIGLGVSITGEAIILKSAGEATSKWVIWGTLGLAILNSGIACFGEAIKYRVHYERGLNR